MEIIKHRIENFQPNVDTVLFNCTKKNHRARIAAHVINKGQNKNRIVLRQFFTDGLYETVYDGNLDVAKNMTVLGVCLKIGERLMMNSSQETDISLSAFVKEKDNENT